MILELIKNKKEFLLCSVFMFLVLFPYWVLGDFSALGWHDEVEGLIPYHFVESQNSNKFFETWAGGHGRDFIFVTGKVFLYNLINSAFDIVNTGLFVRLISLHLIFFGFFSLNKLINDGNRYQYLKPLMLTVLSVVPYGWTLGGMGFDLACAIWLIVAVYSKNNLKKSLLISFCAIGLAVMHSGIAFYPVMFSYTLLFVMFKKRFGFDINFLILAICSISFYLLLAYLNYQSLFKFLSLTELTAREFLNVRKQFDLVGIFSNGFSSIKGFFSSYNSLSYSFLLVPFLLNLRSLKELQKVFALTLFLISPFIVEGVFSSFNFGIISTFRWSILIYMFPVYFLLILEIERVNKYIVIACASLVLLYSSYKHMEKSYDLFKYKGGAANTFYYKELFDQLDKKYRTIVDYFKLNTVFPQYYGMKEFSGLLPSTSYRRYLYSLYSIQKGERYILGHTKLYFKFYTSEMVYDDAALRALGVKYLVSANPSIKYLGDPIVKQKGLKLSEYSGESLYLNLLKRIVWFDVVLARPIYIYDFGTVSEQFFVPGEVLISEFSDKEKDYYQNLSPYEFEKRSILSNELKYDMPKNNDIKILSYEKRGDCFMLNTNSGEGQIVFNQEYSKNWKAQCAQKSIELNPVNGLMTLLSVNEGCREIKLCYSY